MSRPPAFFDESPRSYLIRLSEANGYPNSQPLIQLLGEVPQYVVTSGWDYGSLKSVLGSAAALPEGSAPHQLQSREPVRRNRPFWMLVPRM